MKNWMTTVTGVAGFIIGGCTYKGWLTTDQGAAIMGAVIALLGILAKDWNVTGGTREQ